MKMRTAIAAASVLGLAAGPLLSAISADAGPVAVSKITVLTDDSFVDADQEAVHVIADLEAGGHSVTEIPDVTDEGDFLAKLDAAEVFVIPELENNDDKGSVAASSLPDDFTDAEIEAIVAFVDGGGRILFFGSSDPTDVINGIFGFSLSESDADWCGQETTDLQTSGVEPAAEEGDCDLTAEAADTELADGPTPLTAVDDTTGLAPASLPDGSTTFYGGTFTTGGVEPTAATTVAGAVSMPYGDGVVVFLGWDWYPAVDSVGGGSVSAATVAENEADWAQVLDLAVSQPEVTASVATDGKVTFTSDSPSTQPVFVSFVVNGHEQIVTIAPKTTSTTIAGPTGEVESASFTVPGWGVGAGAVAVVGTQETSTPAAPVAAPVAFTG